MMSPITPIRIVFLGIVIILTAMVIGPLFSPSEFSLLRHTTSEQAGQHMRGAWIMRSGFAAYGLATFAAAFRDRATRPMVRGALALFGSGLVGTAIWSNAPIVPELPADMQEDYLHSVASGVVGLAFAAACIARLLVRGGSRYDFLAWSGLVISIAVPLAMATVPDVRGVMQRAMFAFSFVFVAREFGEPAYQDGSKRS